MSKLFTYKIKKCIISGMMTPKKAFWETVATVCIPSVLFWAVAAYLMRARVDWEAWPIYIVLAALPFPFCFPVYRRYRYGAPDQKPQSRRSLLLSGILFGLVAIATTFRVLEHPGKEELWYWLLMGVTWLLLCVNCMYQAAKTPPA